MHKTAGATIVSSALTGLVAVNVILGTSDLTLLRPLPKLYADPAEVSAPYVPWACILPNECRSGCIHEYVRYPEDSRFIVFNLIEAEANRYGVPVVGTQIVGTLPKKLLVSCAEYFLKLEKFNRDQIIENHLVGL